jgi:hypothetical protein
MSTAASSAFFMSTIDGAPLACRIIASYWYVM